MSISLYQCLRPNQHYFNTQARVILSLNWLSSSLWDISWSTLLLPNALFMGLGRNLLTTPIACTILGLVHTMTYLDFLQLRHMDLPSSPPSPFQLRDTVMNSIWNDLREEDQLTWLDAYWIFLVPSECSPPMILIDTSSFDHERSTSLKIFLSVSSSYQRTYWASSLTFSLAFQSWTW